MKGQPTDGPPSVQLSPAARAADENIKVDLHALDRAREEIDRLHRERQMKEARGLFDKAVQAWASAKAMGPYLWSCTRMSPAEWRKAIAYGWGHFKEELAHYWMGTKLLWVEVKIASRLVLKTLRGEPLTRRERRQMTRTTADVFRLVPFAAFVLIPFMELLLPVALKLFPSMLPSTFRNELKHEEELKKRLKARLELARFLQDTVKVMAKGLSQSRGGYTREKADELYDFMKRVRSGDYAQVTNDDISRFAKLFGNELTLDHISRGQLATMCKFVGLAPYGTDTYLRYQLREKLRSLKQDDRVIKQEGVENLSISELQSASRARGMRSDTYDRRLLETQLKDWLELSLDRKLPSSLLILSRAFTITITAEATAQEVVAGGGAGDVAWTAGEAAVNELAAAERQAAAMREITDTIANLPEEVVISVAEEQNLAANRKEQVERRIEFLEQEEELIKEEIADQKLEENELREKRQKEVAAKEAADMIDAAAAETSFDVHAPAAASGSAEGKGAGVEATEEAAKTKEKSRKSWKDPITIDSVSLDEVESVVAGRRAHRAAKLSRLLAALAGVSSLSVERKELMVLVRKELDVYGRRLRQVQRQLECLEGDEMVAVAVAAEGDVAAAVEILDTPDTPSEEEERIPAPEELTPDETEELCAETDASATKTPAADAPAVSDTEEERMPTPEELVPDEDAESPEPWTWIRPETDAQLCDRVNDRVNNMLAGLQRDLDAADDKIGEKLNLLDADGDGRFHLSELSTLGGILADQLDDDDTDDLQEFLASSLPVDEAGRVSVEDLSALVSELIAREFEEYEGDDDEGGGIYALDEEDTAKAGATIEAMRCEVVEAELGLKEKEPAGETKGVEGKQLEQGSGSSSN